MLPDCMCEIAGASSLLSAATKSRRVAKVAPSVRFRHTRIMLDASAFVPIPTIRLLSSVRMGHVPLTPKPDWMTASRKVSQPVLAVPASLLVSDCLNA